MVAVEDVIDVGNILAKSEVTLSSVKPSLKDILCVDIITTSKINTCLVPDSSNHVIS